MIGDEAAPYQAMLELSKPVEEGTVKNWDDMELLWDYSFKKVQFLFRKMIVKLRYYVCCYF